MAYVHPISPSKDNATIVKRQGFHSRHLYFEVQPFEEAYVIRLVFENDGYTVFFDTAGRITHISHESPPAPASLTSVSRAEP